MKKSFLLLVVIIGLESLIFGDIKIENTTPYKVKFSARWEADVSGNSGKGYEIEPSKSQDISGDLLNKKTAYKAQVYVDGEWKNAFDHQVSHKGNREITLFQDEKGDIIWKDAMY